MLIVSHEVHLSLVSRNYEASKRQSLQESFTLLVSKFRAYVKKQEDAPGDQEKYGETEKFINDLIPFME